MNRNVRGQRAPKPDRHRPGSARNTNGCKLRPGTTAYERARIRREDEDEDEDPAPTSTKME